MRKLILLLLSCLSLGILLPAKAESYYFCDFEDDAENALWTLNYAKNTSVDWNNKWAIGSAEAKAGVRSMYISADGGATAGYATGKARIMLAWREFDSLEPGEYDLAFDWKNVGDSSRAGLYAAWIPESDFEAMTCSQNDNPAQYITRNLVKMVDVGDSTQLLSGSSIWLHPVGKVQVASNTKYRLTLVFVLSGNAVQRNPGPCVDNIQLARNNCGTPTDLQVSVSGRQATFTWTSSAQSFNIRYSRQGSTEVFEKQNLKEPKLILNLDHGVYNFYIQVVCNGEQSVWYAFPVVLIYDSKCFNYLDLQDNQCFYLDETPGNWKDADGLLKNSKGKKIDYGFQSIRSQHTIHYIEGEYDARTYNSIDSDGKSVAPLRTIPDGEIASVRVGTWDEAHVARILYDFTVDNQEASVLMLKYALVLQSSGHEESARPRFTLQVLDAETGAELSRCTSADFAAQTSGDGWYRSPVKRGEVDAADVCWRDWTTVGINLAEFDGKHVQVVLTAYGCTATVHYGYAYFTLNCTAGGITGIQCGDTPTNEFVAPSGFNYKWYLASDKSQKEIGNQQVYSVDSKDDREYKVDVIYKTDAECYFTLDACAIPRYPVADATYQVYQENCKNYIRFTSLSHVRTKNMNTGEVIENSKYPIEALLWDFGQAASQSADPNPIIELPADGDTIDVSLQASVGQCDDTWMARIVVPTISEDNILEKVNVEEGQTYTYQGQTYTEDTTIIYQGKNIYGCDSVHTLQLRFFPPTQTIKADLVHIEQPCAGAAQSADITFDITNGIADTCRIYFAAQEQLLGWRDTAYVPSSPFAIGERTVALSVPSDVVPGRYPFSIYWATEGLVPCYSQGEVVVLYSASIIQQRWNDVLGLLNAEYNGGYEFESYQWYKNGAPVDGAISSYYWEENGLDTSAEYAVMLVRAGEEQGLMSCAYIPVKQAEAPAQTEVRKIIHEGRLYILKDNQIFDIYGQLVSQSTK